MKYVICLCVWMVTFAVGGALFWASNQAQTAASYNTELATEIKQHQEKMTILSAEWHYLNSPAYLERLTLAAFQEGTDTPVMLAQTADLPEPDVVLLPVRKPEVPESFEKDAPVLVAEVKKVQPDRSKFHPQQRAVLPSQNTQREFTMVLANWTQ